jgi:hypothetical protein
MPFLGILWKKKKRSYRCGRRPFEVARIIADKSRASAERLTEIAAQATAQRLFVQRSTIISTLNGLMRDAPLSVLSGYRRRRRRRLRR